MLTFEFDFVMIKSTLVVKFAKTEFSISIVDESIKKNVVFFNKSDENSHF